jgi:hypothetical protein
MNRRLPWMRQCGAWRERRKWGTLVNTFAKSVRRGISKK